MKRTVLLTLVMLFSWSLYAQENMEIDLAERKNASYHAFINAGLGCYYMGNGNNSISGPARTDGIYSIMVVNGAQLGNRFYVGIGLGFESLMTARGMYGEGTLYPKQGSNIFYGFPVYVDARFRLNKNNSRVMPYIMLDIGYEAWKNDPYGTLRDDPAKLWDNCFFFNGGFGVRVGKYFNWECTAGLRDAQMRFGVEL